MIDMATEPTATNASSPVTDPGVGTCSYKDEETDEWRTMQCTKEQCDALGGTWTQ